MSPHPGFRTERVETVFSGRLLRLELRDMTTPEGDRYRREVVVHPGAVAVLPTVAGDAVLLRQHRTPVGAAILEVPAGLLDQPGETPEAAARRECIEEVGLRPVRLELLAQFYTSPGFTDEMLHLFHAPEPVAVAAAPQGAEERAAEVVRIPFDELAAMAARGEIVDAKTLIAIYAVAARSG